MGLLVLAWSLWSWNSDVGARDDKSWGSWGTVVASVLRAEVVGSNWVTDLGGKSWEGEVEAVVGAEVLVLAGNSSGWRNKVAWLREQPEGVVVEGVTWWWLRTGVWSKSSAAVVLKRTGGQVVGDIGLPPVKTGGAVGTETWNKGRVLVGGVWGNVVWDAQVDHEDHVLVKVETWREDGWVVGVWDRLRKLLRWEEDVTIEGDTKRHEGGWSVASWGLSGDSGGQGSRGQDRLDGRHRG